VNIARISICFRLFGFRQFWPKLTPESGQDHFGQEGANVLKNEFYVDDRLEAFSYIIKCY